MRGNVAPVRLATALILFSVAGVVPGAAQGEPRLPTGALVFGAFEAAFDADGSFAVETDAGWPAIVGTWKVDGDVLELIGPGGPEAEACEGAGRYRFEVDGGGLSLRLIEDGCRPRGMILGASDWRPAGQAEEIPERRIVRTVYEAPGELPEAAGPAGSWPSFRGPRASGVAEGMSLPDSWNGERGENILWRTPIAGLAHSSPVVWGERVFVTSAVSSEAEASFRPGLYGDGDAADDRSRHRFEVHALDRRTGEVLWTRIVDEAAPIDKRHLKSTYANATPVTDGRVVIAWFGSQGVYALDVEGNPLWKVDLGRLNLGAYDVPSYEWGPASSPILWQGTAILQADTQADSFLLALDAETGETRWKAERDEIPGWGTPSVFETAEGPELVTNGANFIRGYDPRTGSELWRLGGNSKITAPTPILADGLIVVASGRAPERPIFVVRPGSRGDITLPDGVTASEAVVWSVQRRGPYMPTPLAYGGRLYVLANNGVLDAYELATGKELYRQRLEHRGSGFSASPVAADGKLYLASEDGDILVVRAGPEFEQLATNPMGELLMATPALSGGVMYVRGAQSLFAVGQGPEGRGRP